MIANEYNNLLQFEEPLGKIIFNLLSPYIILEEVSKYGCISTNDNAS